MSELEKITKEEKRKIYLYIKVSPKGLFYLGKFTTPRVKNRTVYTYMGSGTYWKKHLAKYNYKSSDIQTIVLHETLDKKEIEELGLYYSRLFNIIESETWANLKEECGDGGGGLMSKELLEKFRQNGLNRKQTQATKDKISAINLGKKLTAEDKLKKSLARLGTKQPVTTCPHCGKVGGKNVLKRYHFDNCPVYTGRPVDEVVQCCHCNKTGTISNMKRWHFDNCPTHTGIKHITGKYYPKINKNTASE